MSTPVLTVITVVFNDAVNIRRTLTSVTGQTWPALEYVVIDGGSTDGTLDIIRSFGDAIARVVSEPDKGIYDAMNKGLGLATGTHVVFMNSGDEFYDRETVTRIFQSFPDADIYYGETEMIDANLNTLGPRRHRAPEQLRHTSFRFGMSVSHQAIVVRKSIARPYDTGYTLSADIDWILSALQRARTVVNTRLILAKYLAGGMSKKRHLQSLVERYRILGKHYGTVANFFNHLVIVARLVAERLKPANKRLKT